jgi:hypothetical protein
MTFRRESLTKKLAECIDGVELTGHRVGDVLDLPPLDARLLLAEEWAIPHRRTAAQGRPPDDRPSPAGGRTPSPSRG